MDDTIVTLRFTDVGRAHAALQELERLNRAGRLRVRGAARVERSRVERSGDGRIGVSEGAGDGALLPQGEVVGVLLATLSGPVRIPVSAPAERSEPHGTERFERHGKPSAGEDRREDERQAAAGRRGVCRAARRRPLTGSRR